MGWWGLLGCFRVGIIVLIDKGGWVVRFLSDERNIMRVDKMIGGE